MQKSLLKGFWTPLCGHSRGIQWGIFFFDPLLTLYVCPLTKKLSLAGHSKTLMCFFLSHSFVALGMCFGSLSCWNTHPRPIFNALALTMHGPVHRPFDAVQLSCPLSRKTPLNHNVSTSIFTGGDGVLGVIGSIPPLPNMASWVDAKELDFGLIWPQHFHPVLLWIIQMFIGILQTGLYMCFLEQGDLAGFQSFTV